MLGPHPSGALSNSGENILDSEFQVRYINANDGTVEGLDLWTSHVSRSNFILKHAQGPMMPHYFSIGSSLW